MAGQHASSVTLVSSLTPSSTPTSSRPPRATTPVLLPVRLPARAPDSDVTSNTAGAFNFTAKYKYNAWKKLEGMSQDDAKAKYVALLKGMLEAAGDKERLAELEGECPMP